MKPNLMFRSTFLALFATAFLFIGCGQQSGSDSPSTANLQPITILKYSDYQCPACKVVIPYERQLKADFGDLVTIEYRHFPLSGHQFAALAARSFEAADIQGKGQEMHDLIFENQEVWSRGNAENLFNQFAEQIGLDVEKFKADRDSEEVIAEVDSQRREGNRRLVTGTPTYFINGRKINQFPQNYQQFRALAELYMVDSGS